MDYRTRPEPRPQRNVNIPLLVVILSGILVVGFGLYYGISSVLEAISGPTPEEAVERFRDEGLEVGNSYPIEQEDGFEQSPTPKVHESGVRFLIPSACPNECGGRIYSFENEEDLEVMRDYYSSLDNLDVFGPNFGGYTYRNDLLLLQIGSDSTEQEADEYGEVFEDM